MSKYVKDFDVKCRADRQGYEFHSPVLRRQIKVSRAFNRQEPTALKKGGDEHHYMKKLIHNNSNPIGLVRNERSADAPFC